MAAALALRQTTLQYYVVMVIPEALSTIRQLCGMTKSQVAVEAQISLSYYCEIEAGTKTNVSDDVLKRIADALGVSRTAFAPLQVAS